MHALVHAADVQDRDGGVVVIIDAANLRRAQRHRFCALARDAGAAFAIAHTTAPDRDIRRRLEVRRDDASDADMAVFEAQLKKTEPLAVGEGPVINIDSTDPGAVERAAEALGRLVQER